MKRASFILSLLLLCISLPLHGSGMTVNMNDTTVLVYNYTYDEWGRPLTTTLSVNNAEPVTIASNTYDELGRLASTSRNNQASLTTEYDYNIRDWVTEINTPAFTENLYYNISLNGSTPQWSGNISAMAWKAGSDFQNNKLRSYNFTYDGMNRLTAANYWENAVPKGRYSTAYSYDAMSNILSLQRMGRTDDNCFGPIDRLRYEYEGNQLIMVRDSNLWEPTYAHAMHFNDGYNGQVEYEYNANGAMTVDRNKGITIQYNRLNLPQRINYDTGHYTEYTYSADGRKLRTTYYPNMVLQPQLIGYDEFGMPIFGPPPAPTPELTKDYCGPFIYENGTLQRILFNGGYITFDEDSTAVYHFYTKDHLGHVRLVQAADGAIEETSHYYPYGTLFGESTGLANSTQPYKYSGKELDRMHGLDLHDHGARWSDTNLARWHVMDPLAEENTWISPYVLCLNNPIKFVDLDGNKPGDFFKTVNAAAIDFGMYYNDNSIRHKQEFGSTIFVVYNKKGEKGYTYTIPNIGTSGRSVIVSKEPWGAEVVADIHTHGNYSFGVYWDNEFSGSIKNKEYLPPYELKDVDDNSDIGLANKSKTDSYLVTPEGSLQKYDVKTNTITIISTKMPCDSNDPQRLNKNDGNVEKNPITTKNLIEMVLNLSGYRLKK